MFPPVAQGGAGDRPVGDTVARAQQTTGPATTTLWPLAPAQPNQLSNQQFQGIPPLAATPAPAHNQGANRSGTLYSLFSGGGGGSYVAATPATPGQPAAARTYHKVSESVFSAAVGVGMSGYTWGAPTPPPGSPYSPVPMTQLDLLKNFANLAPAAAAAGQQTLSLQGVGVNVAGSLHHAQHTQHTQHTLNLTGFHHLHHGGLHQNAFPPQLSLVAGSAPTLTINSFSSHNPTGNGVAPTGVLLQEYQSPIGATAAPAGCTVTVNGSSCLTNTSSSTANSMVLHGCSGGGGGGNQATGNQTVQAAAVTAKKREAFLSSQGQPVKLENKSTRTSCLCRNSNGKTKVVHSDVGCSRTLPVASSWNGQDGSANNSNAASLTVKREPLASVPCQVAEVSTSLHATTTSVKIEPVPPKSENGIAVPNAGKAVGIAVARQRLQHQETSSMRNVSLSHHTSHHATNYHHFQPDSLGSGTAMTIGGTTLVHCGGPGGENRAAHLAAIPSGALAPSLNLNSSMNSMLNSTLGSIGGAQAAAADAAAATWSPTLWQYSATAAAAMPTEPVGFSQMGSGLQGGFQIIRDPISDPVFVIHAAAEQTQQAVVFPNYHGHNVIPSSVLVPPPPSSIQLLGDIGGARLVLTENKRKQQSASLPIVKIEAECSNSPTAIITSTESSKTALQTMAGALVPDAALVTTLYYPPGSALVQISQAEPTAHCRSQATSPVSCLTPPPEIPATIHAIEPTSFGVQDASNQTDAPEETDEHKQEPALVKQEQNLSPCQVASQSGGTNLTAANFEIVRITTTTTTVNPTVCGIVAKVDKAENTIINMADAAKYLTKGSSRGFARAIEQSSQGVKTTDEDKDDSKMPLSSRSRIGARIIEITEENCDSFHENLEFFARRRDVSADQRDHRDDYSKDDTDAAPNIREKMDIESKIADAPENLEVHCQMCPKLPETAIFHEPKPSAVDSTESSRINCESCDKNRNIAIAEDRPQITKKSFDMPNIDCDDQEVQQVVIKQEAVDNCYEVCYESSRCEPTSTSERSRSSCERLSQEATKRHHSVEKTHHSGIENVVEKLKKSAAALQEAALPTAQKIESTDAEKFRRYSETIPKKLHFLRSCQNSLESNLDAEVTSSQTAEQHDHDQSGQNSSQMEDEPSSASSKCDTSGECLINDNNNDSKSNNNNIKVLEDVKLLAMHRRSILYDTYKPKTVWRCEVHPLGKFNATRKSDVVEDDVTSETIDNSGLLLLSKSIEQHEQRIGQPEHPQPDAYDAENSSVRSELQMSQQSESNNVGNRLRILDLAQIASEIIESDHLEKDGNKRKYPESDDQHVKRYKIDEGKETDQDASFNYHKESITDRTMEIIAEPRAERSTKCTVNFSEEKINVADERVIDPNERSFNEDYRSNENYYSKKQRNAKSLKELQDLPSKVLDETFNNAQNNDDYDKLSDEGSDSESKISSGQPASCQVESKKRKASVEDARGDDHDCKNLQAKLEAKKARKGSRDEGDWSNINATEFDIIAEMANIQKKYKETQLELFKLPPKKDDKKCCGRPRKKSHSSVSSDQGTLPSPPAYELGSSPNSPVKSGWIDDAILPITSAGSIVPTNGTNLEKHLLKIEQKCQIEHQSHIKLLDNIPSIQKSELTIALPDPTLPGPKTTEDERNTGTATISSDISSSSNAAISISASKRRKVGRPRKFQNLTETIVTKKSKSKSAIVDYVLSPKNRHLQTKQYGYTPLPFKSNMSSLRQSKVQKTKRMKQTPHHKKDVIVSSIFGDKAKKHSSGKVKPKLKAEVKVKNLKNDEVDEISPENIPSEEAMVPNFIEETPAESVEQVTEKEPERPKHEKSKKRKRKLSQSTSSESKESKWHKNCTQCKKTAAESIIKRCKLTDEYLKIDQLRILKESNGLFYAGTLSIIQPNEIYAINLDGERGNKPHILPKEEILRDAIVEVRPRSTKEILPGTRLCAYWSSKLCCLYPGISAEPINTEQADDNDVIVEFDDGDSGRISLERIRFLLPDYPFVEYNNPLVSCRKRRRQASASEEKRSVDNDQTAASGDETTEEASTHKHGKTKIEMLCDYHRRKKKTKKDKKLHESQEEKLKHRKHKSSKEHRKERHKHKKHRKHKHKHHDSLGDLSKASMESSFEQKSEEEAVQSKDYLAAEEKISFEEAEELSEDNEPQVTSEELLESAQEDEEGQIESEESAEAIEEDEEEAQIESEELPEAIQEQDAVQTESEESLDLVRESDEVQVQVESKETSELVQEAQVKSEESPELMRRKLRKQHKTPANRTPTSRASANRPSTSRVSTRRAAKTNTSSNHSSTDATASIASSSNSPSSNSSLSSSSSLSISSSNLSLNPSSRSPLNSSTSELPSSNPIETTSAIAPMLPNQRLWKWVSKPNHTSGGNQYYTAIRRGRETINIGDSVLFYSYKPDEKPYIGKIVQLWSKKSEMKVKCDWFYRPEELHQPCTLEPPGGLFESDHRDTNDVQTISHKVVVASLDEYKQMLEKTPQRHQRICEEDTYYYNAGCYKNPKMKLAPGVKATPIQTDNK